MSHVTDTEYNCNVYNPFALHVYKHTINCLQANKTQRKSSEL